MKLRFNLQPTPASRPRVTRTGHTYYAGPYKEFRSRISEELQEILPEGYEPLAGPLKVTITVYCKKTQTYHKNLRWTRDGKDYPAGDFDNYAKAVCDGCNGIVWVDDDQIVDGRVLKVWSDEDEPYIEMEIQDAG